MGNGRLLVSEVGMASGVWLGSKTGHSSQQRDTLIKNLCLSPHQVFWRGMAALGFGLVGGAVGLLAGGIAVGIFGITATIATFSVAGIIAWGASLTFAIVTSGAKNDALRWITREMDW